MSAVERQQHNDTMRAQAKTIAMRHPLGRFGAVLSQIAAWCLDYAPCCRWCHGEKFFDRDGVPDCFGSVRCDAEGCCEGRNEYVPSGEEPWE